VPNPNDPELDLVGYLNGKTGAVSAITLATGTNLFSGPERANKVGVPSNSVFVRNSGGMPATPYFANSPQGDDRQSSLQVIVRSNPNDYGGGSIFARDVFALIQRAAVSGPSSNYIYCLCRQSDPVYVGQNDQALHQFSINVLMRWTG